MNPIYLLPRSSEESCERITDSVQTHRGAALSRYIVCLLASMLVAACSTSLNRAPVVDGTYTQRPAPPGYYRVRRGDTLYRIALQFGQNYNNLVAWNGLANPGQIVAGQLLRVVPPNAGSAASNSGAVTAPVMSSGITTVPLGGQSTTSAASQPPVATPAAPQTAVRAVAANKVELAWPVRGPILRRFSVSNGSVANNKGIDIGGKVGDPILSAAPGRVVYTGTLPGYGRLLVVKHNAMYLTAYAHNQSFLVKEGDVVSRGQRIATMGTDSTGRALLHFEVRKYGKPVDPLLYLPQ